MSIRVNRYLARQLLVKEIESLPAKKASCTINGRRTWWRSHFSLGTTLGMIGNVSSPTVVISLNDLVFLKINERLQVRL